MSIYEEMSMYGDIFIIDTQILIHAQLFPPPRVHSVWKRVRATAAEEVNNWGNHEVELVSKGWLTKVSPAPFSIAPENLSGS